MSAHEWAGRGSPHRTNRSTPSRRQESVSEAARIGHSVTHCSGSLVCEQHGAPTGAVVRPDDPKSPSSAHGAHAPQRKARQGGDKAGTGAGQGQGRAGAGQGEGRVEADRRPTGRNSESERTTSSSSCETRHATDSSTGGDIGCPSPELSAPSAEELIVIIHTHISMIRSNIYSTILIIRTSTEPSVQSACANADTSVCAGTPSACATWQHSIQQTRQHGGIAVRTRNRNAAALQPNSPTAAAPRHSASRSVRRSALYAAVACLRIARTLQRVACMFGAGPVADATTADVLFGAPRCGS